MVKLRLADSTSESGKWMWVPLHQAAFSIMRTIADPQTLASLVERLRQVQADTPRRWGTLTPGEMLCHLGDAQESVLGIRIPPGTPPSRTPRRVLKWIMLYAPWPRGVRTRPGVNPRIDGTRPGAFEADRGRAITSLEGLAAADPASLSACHFMVGPMSAADWYRWAYRHVSHHLRQFGV
jgi:hypothetical protein